MEALRDAARKPNQCTNYSEVTKKIADWEAAVRQYAKEYPAETLSAYEKAKTLKELLPDDLQSNIVRLEKRGYDNIREYAMAQAPLRKEAEMRRKGQTMQINGLQEGAQEPPKIDDVLKALQLTEGLDMTGEEMLSLLRTKGRGKGKGAPGGTAKGGAFVGDCYYCKQPGHRQNACEKYTRDKQKGVWAPAGRDPVPWAQGKGGGKGSPPKGGGKGGKGGNGWNKGLNWFDEPSNGYGPSDSWGQGGGFQMCGVFEGESDREDQCHPECDCEGFRTVRSRKGTKLQKSRDRQAAAYESYNACVALEDAEVPEDDEAAQDEVEELRREFAKLDSKYEDLETFTSDLVGMLGVSEDSDDVLEEAPILTVDPDHCASGEEPPTRCASDALIICTGSTSTGCNRADEHCCQPTEGSKVYSPTVAEDDRREEYYNLKKVSQEPTSVSKTRSNFRRKRWAAKKKEKEAIEPEGARPKVSQPEWCDLNRMIFGDLEDVVEKIPHAGANLETG